MNQAFKASKNFDPKVFKFEESSKNLKNNKFLTNVLPKIHCNDYSIHLPTKVKKIFLFELRSQEDRIKL